MILTMAYLLLFWQTLSAFGSWTIYPPLSATEIPKPESNFFANYLFIPVLLLIGLIVTQTVVAVKTGKLKN